MGAKEQQESLFAWFSVQPSAPMATPGGIPASQNQSDPLLKTLDYYKTITGLALAPKFHEVYSPHDKDRNFAEMPLAGWVKKWSQHLNGFELTPQEGSAALVDAHSVWRWLISKALPCVKVKKEGGGPKLKEDLHLLIFESKNGQSVSHYWHPGDRKVDLNHYLLPQHQLELSWSAVEAAINFFHPNASDLLMPGRISDAELTEVVQACFHELAINKEKVEDLSRRVEVSLNLEMVQGDSKALKSLKAAVEGRLAKFLGILDAVLNREVLIVVGYWRFAGRTHDNSFPVSVRMRLSLERSHQGIPLVLVPLDTPKVSKPNIHLPDREEDENILAMYTGKGELSVSLDKWQSVIQDGCGYEYVFDGSRLVNPQKWNELWKWLSLQPGFQEEGNGSSEFIPNLLFFESDDRFAYLYEAYKMAMETCIWSRRRREGGTPSLLESMVSTPPHKPLDTTSEQERRSIDVPGSPLDSLGYLREQLLPGASTDEFDHFGLNDNQRVFCHRAMNSMGGHGVYDGKAPASDILALNGPPGTGKTTVLQTLVASEVVQSALEGGSPKIIFGCSATNQAKNNLIDGFRHDKVHGDRGGVYKRWIHDLRGIGAAPLNYGLQLDKQGADRHFIEAMRGRVSDLESAYMDCYLAARGDLRTKTQARTLLAVSTILGVSTPKAVFLPSGAGEIQAALVHLRSTLRVWHQCLVQTTEAMRLHVSKLLTHADLLPDKDIVAGPPISSRNAIERLEERKSAILKAAKARQDLILKNREQLARISIDIKDEQRKKAEAEQVEAYLRQCESEWRSIAMNHYHALAPIPRIFRPFLAPYAIKKMERSIRSRVRDRVPVPLHRAARHQRRQEYIGTLRASFLSTDTSRLPEVSFMGAHEAYDQGRADQLSVEKILLENELKSLEEESMKANGELSQLSEQIASLSDRRRSFDSLTALLRNISTAVNNVSTHVGHKRVGLLRLNACRDRLVKIEKDFRLGRAVPSPRSQGLKVVRELSDMLAVMVDNAFKPTLFHLAARWHEGRFIQEVQGLDPKRMSQRDVEGRFRTLARVCPVAVSTLHSLSNRTKSFNVIERTSIGLVDLMIFDEAGQASTEAGAIGLLMSKRAVVVGDSHQLDPIYSIDAVSDRSVYQAKVSPITTDAFDSLSWNSHRSSLLRLAQEYSPWHPYRKLQRGLYLVEHNRCPLEIISLCDQLTYNGQLRYSIASFFAPSAQAGPVYRTSMESLPEAFRPLAKTSLGLHRNGRILDPEQLYLPSQAPFSIISHEGSSVSSRGRFNPDEADLILSWIDENYDTIMSRAAPQGKRLCDVLAIVTPFRKQAALILARGTSGFDFRTPELASERKKLFSGKYAKGDGALVVGTVHTLQGAEIPIVLFSHVYGAADRLPLTFLDKNPELINVAVSRAKQSFYLFANTEFLESRERGTPTGILYHHILRFLEPPMDED